MRRFVRLVAVVLMWSLTGAVPVAAGARPQQGRITLESLYSPDRSQRADYSGGAPRGLRWIDDEHYLLPPTPAEPGWRRVEAASATTSAAVDEAAVRSALERLAGIGPDDAAQMARMAAPALARGDGAALVNYANDLFWVAPGRARRLTFDAAAELGEEISPDGRFVSFVRDYNLHLVDLESGRERSLTADGGADLFYGRLDWVYQEEVYGRGNFKGYWWSPDSSALVFLRLDESPVREFTVVDHLPQTLRLEVTNYPKAGNPNPTVTLGVVRAVGGEITWIDTSRYEPIEHLIVRVGWTPDSSRVVYQVQDREQTWLDLNLADPDSGDSQTLLHEQTPAFVQVLGEPYWLQDGSFLWLSERSGYEHLYRYAADGRLIGPVTAGEWEVRTLYGVDEQNGWVYFAGTADSPIGVQIYRVRLQGGKPARLSRRDGTHAAVFNRAFTFYLDTWSDVNTPPQVRLHAADGSELRTIHALVPPALAALELGDVEFLQVPARDGFMMEAMIIRPPDFDPSRRYPVLQYNYGGPHAPVVRNAWGGTRYLWHQMLAQHGYVVWYCDNRSASGKGIAPTWEAYRQMGVIELRDIEDGLAWLRAQPWVDPARIGIWGWSYGGFMASYALTHSDSFKMGIAGAPVTDWHLYDSIYTERYMRMPQNNPEGYDATSVVKAAANLHGKLLILHGTMDDNVHMQNSVRLIYALQKAGRDGFEFMIYPRSRHGVREPELVWHLQKTMTRFILENL